MREELRQIFQTGVKDKRGHDVNDSHPSLSAERGSSGRAGVRAAGLRPQLALVAVTMLRLIISSVNAPMCLCLFFFLSVYRVISDCK